MIRYEEHTIHERLQFLYTNEIAKEALDAITKLILKYKKTIVSTAYHLSEADSVLITYGDQVQHQNEAPLTVLKRFLDVHVKGVLNSVHILPFHPYSSDDGFSIVNYSEVDPKMGSWREVEDISKEYRLMLDGVINHVSQYSDWFKAYLAGDPEYKDFFIELDPTTDLSQVVRPRATPLLSEFIDKDGKIHNIWTTFSRDQVDLNYKNYKVLVKVLDALFYYIQKGATLIRLDAIAFIYKEIGTSCVHLPQTHELVQLIREILHEVAPEVIIITETNVPHHENISYFGSGNDEAQMVYNFALPPLLAHSILHSDTTTLTRWAQSLTLPSDKVCFFNFTASHDGCGLRPVQELLAQQEIDMLVESTLSHGGLVSYRHSEDGEKPYELNCSYIDILSHPDDNITLRAKRMLVTQAVMLAMPGVPGIYFHSLVGSHNYPEGVTLSGNNRSINRQKYNYDYLEEKLSQDGHIEQMIFTAYKKLLSIKTHEAAFNPFGEFEFLNIHSGVFAIFRHAKDKQQSILALHNFTNSDVQLQLSNDLVYPMYDIIANSKMYETNKITMSPYQNIWLKSIKDNV